MTQIFSMRFWFPQLKIKILCCVAILCILQNLKKSFWDFKHRQTGASHDRIKSTTSVISPPPINQFLWASCQWEFIIRIWTWLICVFRWKIKPWEYYRFITWAKETFTENSFDVNSCKILPYGILTCEHRLRIWLKLTGGCSKMVHQVLDPSAEFNDFWPPVKCSSTYGSQ